MPRWTLWRSACEKAFLELMRELRKHDLRVRMRYVYPYHHS
jgi:hypothetical protein